MEIVSLITLVFSPIIVSILLFTPFFAGKEVRIRRFSKFFAGLHLVYSLLFLVFFQNSGDVEFYKEISFLGFDWVQPLGIKVSFGMDGISLLMVLLTEFITLIALVASKINIKNKHKFYYSLVFALQTALLGVFCARDMYVFFMFWEFELLVMYFLISQWGDANSPKSAMKFLLYSFFGSLFLLLGILLLHFYNFITYGFMSADMGSLALDESFPIQLQMLISVLVLIGFAVKIPIIPFHTWLPDAHVDAVTPVSILLAGVLLKMGTYGLIRFNIQILPDAFIILAPILMLLALINIIYSAFVAYNQKDLKKLVAYSSISHMGIVLLGLCALNLCGLSGSIFHMVSHGFISAGLFMVVGVVYLRTKTRDLTQLGGFAQVMPRLSGFAIILTLAALGLPLLMGFVGEFLTFFGTFTSKLASIVPVQIIASVAIFILIFSAAYMLKFLHKCFYENIYERWEKVKDITNHEFFVLSAISAVVVFFGIFPISIMNLIQPILLNILENVRF